MPTSLEIAQSAPLLPIAEIAARLGLADREWEPRGHHVAKIELSVLDRLAIRPKGRLIVVTAITPTPAGEGKTTTAIGLVDALHRIGVRAALTVRQPSLGPIFGIKGGGNGGGRSQVLPIEEFNLHLTGDIHAVGSAHNLAAAFLDNHLAHGNALQIDPYSITWPRVVDVNDRALRDAVIGLGGRDGGVPRQTEWHITAASEVMAILALCSGPADLRARLGRIVLAEKEDGTLVTAEHLKVAGAMAVLLRDALRPNLMQTLEGSPALVHTGPFGNIAQVTSSVLADRIALELCDAVCTEAGFGADLGGEKFVDIKCRQSGLRPSAAVVVATVRALKMHGGVGRIVAGKPLDPALKAPDPEAVRRGCANLAKQIENVLAFGIPAVVAINSYPEDAAEEVAVIREMALAAGARAAVESHHFERGGEGAVELAREVWAAAQQGSPEFKLLYPDDAALTEKVETIARRMYGAEAVDFTDRAARQAAELERVGFRRLPICVAKTHLSLSHRADLRGRPTGFRLPVREMRVAAGAGFVTAVAGEMRLMPGLPTKPAGEGIDLDPSGRVTGLF